MIVCLVLIAAKGFTAGLPICFTYTSAGFFSIDFINWARGGGFFFTIVNSPCFTIAIGFEGV